MTVAWSFEVEIALHDNRTDDTGSFVNKDTFYSMERQSGRVKQDNIVVAAIGAACSSLYTTVCCYD
jgi:hypothetical protein